MLGGVAIPNHPGLIGHSDGDALVHAVIDALLGAAAEGDVGSHFPPTDDQWRDADSIVLLAKVAKLLSDKGWSVHNIDVVVVTESPKIVGLSQRMRKAVAKTLGIDTSAVSIKGKSNEGMGWIGAGEGLAVHAVACLTEQSTRDPSALTR